MEQNEQSERELKQLESEQAEYRIYSFQNSEQLLHHHVLTELVKELELFSDQDLTLPNNLKDIKSRTEFLQKSAISRKVPMS